MATLNCTFLSGYVTRDAETRFVGAGTALATFSIGVTRSWQDKDGKWQKETSFVDVKAWAALAERTAPHLTKGAEVAVSGRLEQERWTSPDGAPRSKLVVVADRIDVIGQPKEKRQPDSDDVPF